LGSPQEIVGKEVAAIPKNRSGGTGFEAADRCYPITGLANRQGSAASTEAAKTCDTPADRVASCVALLEQESPDLAAVVRGWNDLPEAVRTGILAMIRASAATPGGGS
jgi:hypothetical protein